MGRGASPGRSSPCRKNDYFGALKRSVVINVHLQRRWPLFAFAAAAAALLVAHAFETFGGYRPCELCLRQREIYWAALALAGLAMIAVRLWRWPNTARLGDVALGLAFLTGAVVAGYHAGVEWKFWPGPATCSGGGLAGLSGADIVGALTRRNHAPSCTEAAWRMAGVSMAGYNTLLSLALAGLSFLAASAPSAHGDEHG